MTSILRKHFGWSCLLLLNACTLGTDYRPPTDRLPAAFDRQTEGSGPASTASGWWHSFHDSDLDRLVDVARQSNSSVMQARAAIAEARAAVDQAHAGLLPTLTADGSEENGRQFTAPSYHSPAYRYGSVGFDAGWELDLWGKQRRGVEAAKANAEGAEANADDAMLTLIGDVVRNYAQLRGDQEAIAATQVNLADDRDTVSLMRRKMLGGDGTRMEVLQAQANLARDETDLPSLEADAEVSVHALGILCNANPGAFTALLATPGHVPTAALPSVPLPADVVRTRPNVRAAERTLAANTAQVGVAIASRLPSLRLDGSFSLSGNSLANMLAAPLIAFGPSLKIPILDGQGNAPVEIARSRVDQAFYAYRAAELKALQDVADALSRLHGEQQRRSKLAETVALASQSRSVIQAAFLIGAVGFLDVITSQRDLDQARVSLAQSRATELIDTVAVYKALGAGYAAR